MSEVRLTEEEIADLTSYERPSFQLKDLHSQGYWRASLDRKGRVKLERAHYEAVCAGAVKTADKPRPALRENPSRTP